LLGPAIGIALGAALCVGLSLLMIVAIIVDEGVNQDVEDVVALSIFGLFLAAPSLISLIGAWAMYRGHGLVAAWIGAIASVLPCNPCFFIAAGFGIWGMVVLNDSAVHEAMQ